MGDNACATAVTTKGPFDGDHMVGDCVAVAAIEGVEHPSHLKLLGCGDKKETFVGTYGAAGCKLPFNVGAIPNTCRPAAFSKKDRFRRLNATSTGNATAAGVRHEKWECEGVKAANQVVTQESSTDYALPKDLKKAACEAIQKVHDATFLSTYQKTASG